MEKELDSVYLWVLVHPPLILNHLPLPQQLVLLLVGDLLAGELHPMKTINA